jgi:methylthioribose-1-phosphate isomerase
MNVIEWRGDRVRFIDQTRLPVEEVFVETDDYRVVCEAIKLLKVRGAPLIGIAAAYAAALAAINFNKTNLTEFHSYFEAVCREIGSTRPTAVNLLWALGKVRKVADGVPDIQTARAAIIEAAIAIHRDDAERCDRIGTHGSELIKPNSTVLTHCNTGALATGGTGTAFSVIFHAHKQGKIKNVYVDETRPLLQGARLTTWELMKAAVPCTLITDDMGAFLMQRKKIDAVITGADRIAANGDTANKIGTYNLAVAAHYHNIPFYVAAPTSTIDKTLTDGSHIPIEERGAEEITSGFGKRTAPEGVKVYSPAFDVTPAELITAIVTEEGVSYPPYGFRG